MKVYLDNASTTQVYPTVIKAMENAMLRNYGNPNSNHAIGEKALKELNESRKIISKHINARPEEIIFTSGATEANNLALSVKLKKKKILISSFEHASVYEYCMSLKDKGYHVSEIPVSSSGQIDFEVLNMELSGAGMLSIIHGHNELGVIQDIKRIAELCKKYGVILHVDAAQSFTKVQIDVNWGISLLSASSHKIGGPKGSGLLYVKNGLELQPRNIGGSQEFGRRAGTQNMPGIVGFAKAAEINSKVNWKNVEKMRDEFISGLEKIGGEISCLESTRLPGHIHVYFSGINSEQFVISLSQKGIYCSSRSACMSKQKEDDRILSAVGKGKFSNSFIRLVLSSKTNRNEIKYALKVLGECLKTEKKI